MREDPRAKVLDWIQLRFSSLYQKWISLSRMRALFELAKGSFVVLMHIRLMAAVKCGVNHADYIEAVQRISRSLKHAMPYYVPSTSACCAILYYS